MNLSLKNGSLTLAIIIINITVNVCSLLSEMSRIKLSKLGQDLFNFSDLTWPHLPIHPSIFQIQIKKYQEA